MVSEDELNTHRAVEHLQALVAAARGIVPPVPSARSAPGSPLASLSGLAELYRRAEGAAGDTNPGSRADPRPGRRR